MGRNETINTSVLYILTGISVLALTASAISETAAISILGFIFAVYAAAYTVKETQIQAEKPDSTIIQAPSKIKGKA